MKSNLALGLVGGIVGAIIGSILWIIIGQIGFIAGIAGYAIVYCSVKGFVITGKGISKQGIVICVIFSVLAILFAELISTGLMIYQAFKNDYDITIMDAMISVPAFLGESEILFGVIKNLVVGYGLAIWASFSYVKGLWKQIDELNQPTVEKQDAMEYYNSYYNDFDNNDTNNE